MLLLMRRAGEIIRINDKFTLQVIKINSDSVSFILKDATLESTTEKKTVNEKEAEKEKDKENTEFI